MDTNLDNSLAIALPNFLRLFTSNGISMPKAISIAGKVYKTHKTPAMLSQLNDATLISLGVEDKEDRKRIVSSLQKAGYKATQRNPPKTTSSADVSLPTLSKQVSSVAGSSRAIQTTTSPRKRRRPVDSNEFLPNEATESDAEAGNFEFNEVTDEETLQSKSIIINRAPIMMAWATLVAERIHFSRDEALSIASVYTEMNAISKGVSLGIYTQGVGRAAVTDNIGDTQPYVQLMGRRPLYRTRTGKWRGLSNGKPVPPSDAFSYITRSFQQTTSYIFGALKLLAFSYSPEELKVKAWSLYAEFRPEVNEWGKRSQVRCRSILKLRKKRNETTPEHTCTAETSPDIHDNTSPSIQITETKPQAKRAKRLTVEEYEELLDQDITFNNVSLDY